MFLLAAKFELTKASRESLLAATTAGWRTPRRDTPYQERPSISRALVACEELWLPAGELHTFCWGSSFVSFRVPQILTMAVPQSRGVNLC